MIKIILYTVMLLPVVKAQNLILNPSFEEIKSSRDTNYWHHINFGNTSDVLHWYIPTFCKRGKINNYELGFYYTAKDTTHHKIHKIYPNAEQWFNKNNGFIRIYTGYGGKGFVQQRLATKLNKGSYCFKFKYKKFQYSYGLVDSLDFSFSKTNLREYFYGNYVQVPDSLIYVAFDDSKTFAFDLPWQQHCSIIHLKGGEQFLSIGPLKFVYKAEEPGGKFYIDDIELISIEGNNTVCDCQKINKDLTNIKTNFLINKKIDSDALAIFGITQDLETVDPFLLNSTATIEKLNEIISFMQKNKKIKVQFISHDCLNFLPKDKNHQRPLLGYINYLNFYGITNDRISQEWGIITDTKNTMYYGISAPFDKISFMFYE